jgi:phenylacetate-CoA ligase
MLVVMFIKSILLRKGLRSDKIWCNPLLFCEPFRRIPFYLDVYALMKSQYWPREELKKLSLERFVNIVKHASTMPFWKEQFEEAGIDPNNFHESDIARIPILTKKDFLDKNVADYTDPELFKKSHKYHTSGSTGRPFDFYHDKPYELRSSTLSERMFRAAGNGVRYPLVHMRNHPNVGFAYAKYHFFYVLGYNSVRHRIHELAKLISSFPEGVILYGIGSSLLEVARVCRELNISPKINCILSTGEELRDSQRKEIEEALQTQVRLTYGMSEMRRLGFECEQRRIHLNEDAYYFEITDDNGFSLPPGTNGRVVVTGFDNYVMPFIRYDTGDVGIVEDELCNCGRTFRTINFQGRKVQLINVGAGRTVSLIDFFYICDRYCAEIRQFQLVRNGECAFTIRIIPGGQFNEKKIETEVTEQLRMRIHPRVQIHWEVVDIIPEGPNGKVLYFIDEFEKNP